MCWFLILFSLFWCSIRADEGEINRSHIPYLVQKNEVGKALELYGELKEKQGKHDFEVLEQMGTLLLEKGVASTQPEEQLLALYGSAYASLSSTLNVLEQALKSSHAETQLAAIHLLARIDDDRCNQLLNGAMNSDFFYTRMEAAYQLAIRKDRAAVGQIEALMHRVPDQLRPYFPPFFGVIGTRDGIKMLKTLLFDSDEQVRIEAILSGARNGREELLPTLRKMATHPSHSEQEACAFALGELKDAHSLGLLQKMSLSHVPAVRLAAARGRMALGDREGKEVILALAKEENLFAINLLGEVDEGADLLDALQRSTNAHVKAGSALALLKKRDPRCAPFITELLMHDVRDWGFYPFQSTGRSLFAWKVLPSLEQHQKNVPYDLQGMTLSVREAMLRDALELPEEIFLKMARTLFTSKQMELIPLLVRLVENLGSEEATHLLKEQAMRAGAPLIRGYCTLSLYRLKEKGPYDQEIKRWLEKNKGKELIRFRKVAPKHIALNRSDFDLTPEENARLLIEMCEALSTRHDENSLDLILTLLKEGNPKNRHLLAGLLLKALQ